jgi:hypothetical protein
VLLLKLLVEVIPLVGAWNVVAVPKDKLDHSGSMAWSLALFGVEGYRGSYQKAVPRAKDLFDDG